ncbi:magnesium chelatase subunit D [Roseomonas sp. CAU 1739]|uniref:magnesium chelatase subunit D n=1 Tax=Roseomonas sp. CAU 1739 TaxID=3140364 RepID=UPI00325C235C
MTAAGEERDVTCAALLLAEDANAVLALLAVDPVGLGGVALRAAPGPLRDRWLGLLREAMPAASPWRRMPADTPDSRVLGGLDLGATLAAGRPLAERGILAEADGGVVVLPMAERLAGAMAARIAAVLDSREVVVERDGLARRWPAHISIVALDEGIDADELPPAPLLDRLAFAIGLDALPRGVVMAPPSPGAIARARAALPNVTVQPELLRALCATGLALGVTSPRAALLALRTMRAAAALAGRGATMEDDAALAARLVLAPRATCLPPAEPEEAPPDTDQAEGEQSENQPATTDTRADDLTDMVIEAARAAMPPALLARLAAAQQAATRAGAAGRAGAARRDGARGRALGAKAGRLHDGARLALIETLRAAAPWQAIRRQHDTRRDRPVLIRAEDIRLRRHEERSGTTAIFAVDASGSTALHRMAEAKGAVEMLLGECYARRDRVALIAFRRDAATVLLPPTQALARARRCLAALPGGGATPLAAALDAARVLAEAERRQGRLPLLILMTDGRANVARDGQTGRAAGEADALAAAPLLRAMGLPALLVDTAPRPQPFARRLAEAMGGRHVPLPQADAARLSSVVGAVARAA